MYKPQDNIGINTPITDQGRIARYFLALFIFPIFLYVMPFCMVHIPSYPKLSSNPDDYPILSYGFDVAGRNADVVIYGDSTANHGINPRQLSAELGEKVLNIPSNLSVLLVDDDLPLEHYIQLNTPPKIIVFYLAPWNLDYRHDGYQQNALYTGIEMLLRYGSSNKIVAFLKAHPAVTIQFPLMFYRANLTPGGILQRGLLRQQALQVASTNGHVDAIGKSSYDDQCLIPQSLVDRQGVDTVRQLVKKYTTAETQVLVYLAPIPSCRNAQSVVNQSLQAHMLSPPKILPASLYVRDEYYGHLYAAGVPLATENLVEAIRQLSRSSNH